MIKDIIKDEALLSQPCEAATAEDAQVAQDLVDTLLARDDAACLAANQIGVAKAVVAYLDEDDKPHVMYNPVLKKALRRPSPSKPASRATTRRRSPASNGSR